MTVQEIEDHAYRSTRLAEDATTVDQTLYEKLRFLYATYRIGKITLEEATRDKRRYIKQYEMDLLWYTIFKNHVDALNRSGTLLADANCGECERCKQLARVIDGRDQGTTPVVSIKESDLL